MSLRPQALPPVSAATTAAVQAAFPKGHLYVELRAEFGTLYDDQLFADLYPLQGRPVEVAPWRLALVMVMQYIEGLTDRQAADAVRRCMDRKYALSLDLTDPGFDFTLLHDFRCRVLTHEAGQQFLDTLSGHLQSAGLGEGAWDPTDRFHARPGGDPHPAPVGACHGGHALGPQSAQRRGSRLGRAAGAAGMVHALRPAVRPSWLAEGCEYTRGTCPSDRGRWLSAPGMGAGCGSRPRLAGSPRPGG